MIIIIIIIIIIKKPWNTIPHYRSVFFETQEYTMRSCIFLLRMNRIGKVYVHDYWGVNDVN